MGLQGSNASNVFYRVSLQTKGGKNVSLADNISDRQEARWIVSQIEKLVGLKNDTHVVLQGTFGGDYSGPTQRGISGAAAPHTLGRTNKLAAFVGVAGFMLWTGYVFY